MLNPLSSSFSMLKAKLILGYITTVSSCVLFALILVLLERQNNIRQESELEESGVGNDTQLEVFDQGSTVRRSESIDDATSKGSIKEQDDHARPDSMKKKYRKLMLSQRILIGLQVTVLTLLNYLLLVFLPGSGWLPFFGSAAIWVLTLHSVISDEIRRQRLDRLLILVTLYLLIAAGLTLTTYCSTVIKEGQIYQGPARIVGYDSTAFNNVDGQTIRANLKVNWGGSWGCPETPSKFCTADVNGALCEVKYTPDTEQTQAPYNGVYMWQTQSPYTDDVYDTVLYKDTQEEVDVEQDVNGEETLQVVYNNGTEFVDVYKEDGQDEVDVEYESDENGSVIDEDEVFGNSNIKGQKHNTSRGNDRNYRRFLDESANFTTENVEVEVDKKVNEAADIISKEVQGFEDKVYDQALGSVNNFTSNYDSELAEQEITIDELMEKIADLQSEHDKLQKENANLQSELDSEEKKDEDLIEDEIKLTNKMEQDELNEVKYKKTDGGLFAYQYSYDDSVYSDDYWQYQWDNVWGEYSCEDLFNQDMNQNDAYDPKIQPGCETPTNTTTTQQPWPTIQIYGSCNSCTAYIMDYYSSNHFNEINNFQNQARGYFMAAAVTFVLSLFFYLHHIATPKDDNKVELLQSSNSTTLYDGVLA